MKSTNRICSALLAVALCLSLVVPTLAAEGGRQTVTVSQSFPAVHIEGTNAGMLDDQWKKRSVLSTDGTVYIPLKTVGLWMGAATDWNRDAGIVTITSTGAEPTYYSVKDLYRMGADYAFPENSVPNQAPDDQGELLPGLTVTVDGQTQSFVNALGQPVYPLLFHDCVYLPVRSVAGWMDKQVLWTTATNRLGEVHIYDAPTQAELDGARIYLDAVQSCVKNARAIFEGEAPKTEEEYLTKVRSIQSDLKTVWTMPAPSFQGFMPMVETIREYVEVTLAMSVDRHLPLEEGSGVPYIGGTPQRILNYPGRSFSKDWNLLRESMAIDPAVAARENMTTYFMDIEKWCVHAEEFLNVIISSQPTV